MFMILPKTINERFYKALTKKWKEYGRGFNKFICLETGYSSGYVSQVLNGNQDASQEAQIKISEACGLDYKSFLEESPPKDNHDIAELKAEMQEIKAMLPDRIPSQNDLKKYLQKKNKDHHALVDTFEQPELAYELNCILKKIETIQKTKFTRIKKFLLDELEELEASKRRQPDKVSGEFVKPNGTGK